MRIFNNQNVLAFILLTVFANGFVSINILEKNKRYYTSLMKSITEENVALTETLAELKSEGMAVTVTMYQPVRYQTDSTPNILADGTRIRTERASNYKFIAVSRNLWKRRGGWLDNGDFVLLRGTDHKDGVYQVRDTMHKRWVNRVDILESGHVKPYKFTDAVLHKTDLVATKEQLINN
jgi:3D (Asp-Asp-Asp) domain-containing protein